jgi:NADP-dependent 3-hydroxy acid dehydrogenase YdfG
MNKLLTGKVAIAAGPSAYIISSVVQTLLQEGATVIVAAKSAKEIESLKEQLIGTNTGKLVTLLTDYPDYDKVFEISESITEQFGRIDIAIICFDSIAATAGYDIIETDIIDWEKMIDNNITAYFVGARVLLGSMKQYNKGMFVSIVNTVGFENENFFAAADLASCMQMEMAKMFFEEAAKYNIKCYHLSVMDEANDKKISNDAIGKFIMQLYNGSGNASLFQNLKITARG